MLLNHRQLIAALVAFWALTLAARRLTRNAPSVIRLGEYFSSGLSALIFSCSGPYGISVAADRPALRSTAFRAGWTGALLTRLQLSIAASLILFFEPETYRSIHCDRRASSARDVWASGGVIAGHRAGLPINGRETDP